MSNTFTKSITIIMLELHQGHKKRRIKHIILAFMFLVIVFSASSSMPFTPDNGAAHQQGQRKQSMAAPEMDSKLDYESVEAVVGEETCKELGTLGSRPPNCEHKCKRCIPCQAIQVPTTSDHLGIEFANYEPEGWKCKCGNSYFNP